ncbi:MAG: NAD(P)H:quinone oxidoreductase [Burkholderiales bacterium]
MIEILVLYYSAGGSLRRMAEFVAEGVERERGARAKLRTVPSLHQESAQPATPYCELTDLEGCAGIALGSPARFGNMAAPLKALFDETVQLWMNGALAGKPASVFTSAGSMHGGHETTLVSMMLPLLHHGMLIVGTPYTQPELLATRTGGTPYGPSHFAGVADDQPISDSERTLCVAQGRRLAAFAAKLAA